MEYTRLDEQSILDLVDVMVREDAIMRAKKGVIYSGEEWTESNFTKDLNGKWDFSFVAKNGCKVFGFAICSLDKMNHVHIHRFLVKAEAQGMGTGKQLLSCIERVARELGITEINLCVNNKNESAIRFYKKQGFKILTNKALRTVLQETDREGFAGEFIHDKNTGVRLYYMAKRLGEK